MGISQISFAASNNKTLHGWGWSLAVGILDLLVGIILLFDPGITMVLLPFIVGFWFMVRGLSLISYSTELQRMKIPSWGWLLLGGVLTIIFALLIVFNPLFGAITIVIWTAMAFIVSGFFTLILAFRLKKIKDVLFKNQP